jgi:heme exporter protein C
VVTTAGALRAFPRVRGSRLVVAASLAFGLMVAAVALIAYYVPEDADQGLSQKIFYIHVPIALTSYVFFGVGAFYAARYLLRRDPDDDLKSYVALHIGIIFGTLVLLTGPIWAKVSWGHWWNWSDEQLNVFLILFLFYSAYFMLRFSLDPGPQRAAYSSAYALLGIGLVPLSFVAVHVAKSLIHPIVFTSNGPQMDNPMLATFLVWWAGILALGFAMFVVEMSGKRLDVRLRRVRAQLQG